MIGRQSRMLLGALLGAALTAPLQAGAPGAQFSAEMLSRAPDGQVQSGRMYVGDGRMRTEMSNEGRSIVQISDRNRQMEWVLFPDDRTYLERGAPPGAPQSAAPAAPPSAETSPCANLPELSCRRVGEETVGGRSAIKWEIAATRDGQTHTGAQWLDVERGLPLKSLRPDGQTMELRLLGNETLNGRTVEKQELILSAPDRQPIRTFQWYDPQIQWFVRQEFPGGYVTELKDIQVGEQPDELFAVPAGYQRQELPAPGSQPPRGQMPGAPGLR